MPDIQPAVGLTHSNSASYLHQHLCRAGNSDLARSMALRVCGGQHSRQRRGSDPWLLSISARRVEARSLLQGSNLRRLMAPFLYDTPVSIRAVVSSRAVSERSSVTRLSLPTQSAHVRFHCSKGVTAVKESS